MKESIRLVFVVTVLIQIVACTTAADVVLDVPFEENHGNTCASSSMTMMVNYHGIDLEWADIFALSGGGELDSVIDFEAVSTYIEDNHGATLFRLDDCTVDDVFTLIDAGYPVMILQTHSTTNDAGHNRVAIGYNSDKTQIMFNDPSDLGPAYWMTVEDVETCWENWDRVGTWRTRRFFWVVADAGDIATLLAEYHMLDIVPEKSITPTVSVNTMAASILATMIRAEGVAMSVSEVRAISGDPPVIDYSAVDTYLQANYGLRFIRYDDISFSDILTRIDAGQPVMVLQSSAIGRGDGIHRLVLGRKPGAPEVLVHDPFAYSSRYIAVSRPVFEQLWSEFNDLGYGWPAERFYWVVEPE